MTNLSEIEAQEETDENDFFNERVHLLLQNSENIITYNIFLQFKSSEFQLAQIYQEYYFYRRSVIMWHCEYILASLALLYYSSIGNIQNMLFFDRTNFVFLLSFLCVMFAAIFAVLSRFCSLYPLFGAVEVKWFLRYLGLRYSRVQLYESCVFYFAVLSTNLLLLARVVGGKCPHQEELQTFRLWYLQGCNPMAEVSATIVIEYPY
jgi:hypothetical protein